MFQVAKIRVIIRVSGLNLGINVIDIYTKTNSKQFDLILF